MPAIHDQSRFDEMSRKWLALAERRLAHAVALYRSGRWQRYYDAERLAALIRESIAAVQRWKQLAGRTRAPAADKNGLHPTA
jgi:uncharacterized repeat protein (TIGR03809 family)